MRIDAKLLVFMIFIITVIDGLQLMAGGEIVFEDLARPSEIHIRKGRLFVVDFPYIYVYSADDYRLIKKFGGKGEGPREFSTFARLHFHGQYIVVQSKSKLTYYDQKTDYLKEQKIPPNARRGLKILENGYLISRNVTKKGEGDGNVSERVLELCDREFKKIKKLYRQDYYFKRTLDVNAIYLPEARRRIALRFYVSDNKVFVEGEDGETGNIYVLDFNGKKLRTITHSYSKLKVTDRHKKAVLEWHEFKRYRLYKGMVERKQAWFPEYFPAVHYFSMHDGIIYTIPYKLEQDRCVLHMFRPDGTFIKKLPVPLVKDSIFTFYPFTIKRNIIYQLVENDDGDWALRLIELEQAR